MHFHLPKPLHGWRAFVGEIAIIVIGVLIALGAEQVVEWLHWTEKVQHAREGLREEVAGSYRAAAERLVETPCLNAQLDLLKGAVLHAGSRLAPVPVMSSSIGPVVFRHTNRLWGDPIWQSTISEQVSSHLSNAEREGLASLYGMLAVSRDLNRQEAAADGAFLTLASPLSLDPSLRAHLLEVIESERARANLMNLIARQELDQAKEVFPQIADALDSEWVGRMRQEGIAGWCRSHGLPIAAIPQ